MLGNNPLDARSRAVPAKTYEFVLQWLNPFLLAGPNWSKKNIGVMGQYYCEACGGLETFRYQVRYIYIHFLFMLSFVVRRRYVMACDRCGASLHVEAENIKELLNKDPVPWIRRRGWALCLGAVALMVAVWHANNFYEHTVSGYRIGSPEAGDLYLVDFSRIPGSARYQFIHSYGYMRVIKVEANTLAFAPSYSASSVSASPVRDAMRDNPARFEFSADDAIVIGRSRLPELLDNETILEVKRE